MIDLSTPASETGCGRCIVCGCRGLSTLKSVFTRPIGGLRVLACPSCGHTQRDSVDPDGALAVAGHVESRNASSTAPWLWSRLPRALRTRASLAVLDVG